MLSTKLAGRCILLLVCLVGVAVLADDSTQPTSSDSSALSHLTNNFINILLNLINGRGFTTSPPQTAGDPSDVQRSYGESGSQRAFRRYNSYNNNHRGSHNSRRNGHQGCGTNYNFDHIQLTLQWGPGFCATSPNHCQKVVPQFTVHGLWLQSRDGEGPEFCCFDNSFDYRALVPILPDLQKYWFSYFSSNNRAFWSHEWLKHGTCARDVPQLRGELNYFNTTLELVKKLPILDALRNANIVPDKSKTYLYSQFNEALKIFTGGKDTQVDCDLEHHQSTPVLSGVNFCFDTKLNFVDCPPVKQRCRKQLYFVGQ